MADYPVLHAELRTIRGKNVSRLRRVGLTPIVVYGGSAESVSLQTETKELVNVLSLAGGTQLVAIEVAGEGKPRMALAREVQRHVTRLTPIHADFLEVDVTQLISSEVPIVVEGTPVPVRQGEAVLQMSVNTVMVEALPGDLPAAFTIDSARFVDFEDAVYIRDLEVGANVTILNDPDDLVARLAPSRMAMAEEMLAEELIEEEEAVVTEEVPEGEAEADETRLEDSEEDEG